MDHMTDIGDIRRFVRAGRAIFTLRGVKERFTYKITRPDDSQDFFFFVAVLSGTDRYTYMGVLTNGQFKLTAKSKIGEDALSYKAFRWFWGSLAKGDLGPCEFWHEGQCGRCGRALTVPESIRSGLGPVCTGIVCEGV